MKLKACPFCLYRIYRIVVIATANTLMSMRNSSLQVNRRKSNVQSLKRTPSKDSMSGERQQMKQGRDNFDSNF